MKYLLFFVALFFPVPQTIQHSVVLTWDPDVTGQRAAVRAERGVGTCDQILEVFQWIGTTTGTTWTDTNVFYPHSYVYRVRAVALDGTVSDPGYCVDVSIPQSSNLAGR